MTTAPRSPMQKRVLDSLRGLPLSPRGKEYLDSRGLLEVAEDLGFGVVPDSPAPRLRGYAGRLVIPSIGPRDNVYDVAFRCMFDHDCKAASCAKYLFLPGVDKRLYNLRALARSGGTIEITEGQLDAATLEACGLHAVGVPGANGWKPHHHRLFNGFDQVRVWGDGDTAGREFAQHVAHAVAGAEVMMVPSSQDINEVFVEGGKDAILEIAEGEADDDRDEDGEWGLPGFGDDPTLPPF